ncbi:MAG: adenylate/guanylate cyclase domain-containing protein [Pseudomonadota bacterium]
MDARTKKLSAAAAFRDWLIGPARMIQEANALSVEMLARLADTGLPVDRMSIAIPTLHADRRGLGWTWTAEAGEEWQDYAWDNHVQYQASPYHVAHQTGDWVVVRPGEVAEERFGITAELRAGGYTHYVCIPVFFRDGDGGITFATQASGGFSPDDLEALRIIEPAFAMLLDLRRAWRLVDETMRMYVGDDPHDRILAGEVRRGEVAKLRAALIVTDMRGFTALSARLSAEETVALLNRYFDCVVPAIERHGGQVLKFIGDGVLAINRVGDGDGEHCQAALATARAIMAEVAQAGGPDPSFAVKIALHVGEVAYGNIGSGSRLDYTVIGDSVNLASRLADLAGRLERPVAVSEAFASTLGAEGFISMGAHTLRGIAGPQQVYALADETV